MATTLSDIAASFDIRAPRYNKNDWHRLCAEQLVRFSGVHEGHVVLDAGTGTGFAAIAAALVVGRKGRVIGVDVSAGMLRVAQQNKSEPTSAPIEWVQGNAANLLAYEVASFDAVLCSAALLYMPMPDALAEWHRLLKPGGTVAISSMRAGFPVGGRLFRECAAQFGFCLVDPSEPLGSENACHTALQAAGFSSTTVASSSIPFTTQDIGMAWESNLGSAAHEAVRAASPEIVQQIKASFEQVLAEHERLDPGSLSSTEVLFAKGTL